MDRSDDITVREASAEDRRRQKPKQMITYLLGRYVLVVPWRITIVITPKTDDKHHALATAPIGAHL